ncbi:F-box protein [Aspergillus stella-maris]|uniref:F-box protein n=1 Tax=Aspergillus stella-maris TaxID=1810926 RepID=UPI003CCD6388
MVLTRSSTRNHDDFAELSPKPEPKPEPQPEPQPELTREDLFIKRQQELARTIFERFNAFFRILDLPVELLNMVCSFLDIKDQVSFRETSIVFAGATISSFGKRFRVLQTDLSLESLHRLRGFSRHARFSRYVTTLVIRGCEADKFDPRMIVENKAVSSLNDRGRNGLGEYIGQGNGWERDEQGLVELRQRKVRWLSEIIRNLVNCSSFRVCASPGSGRGQREGGENEKSDGPDPLSMGDAVTVLLRTIIEVGKPLKEFGIIGSEFDLPLPRNLDALDALAAAAAASMQGLSMVPLRMPQFSALWRGVRTLNVSLKIGESEVAGDMAIEMIRRASSLTKLTVDCKLGKNAQFMDRLFTTDLGCRLEEVKLQNAQNIDYRLFQSFLSKHRATLRSLNLFKIHFESREWVPTIGYLASGFPALRDISFAFLTQGILGRYDVLNFRKAEGVEVGEGSRAIWSRGSLAVCTCRRPCGSRIIDYQGPFAGQALEVIYKLVKFDGFRISRRGKVIWNKDGED